MTATIPQPGDVLRVKVGAAYVVGRVFPSACGRINLHLPDGGQIFNVQPHDYEIIAQGPVTFDAALEQDATVGALQANLIVDMQALLDSLCDAPDSVTAYRTALLTVGRLHKEICRVNDGGEAA